MPEPFLRVSGPAAVLPQANIDTDVIIRIERLTQGDLAQIGHYAFEALRYLPDGTPNPDFPFNKPKWKDAPILLAGPNFGCGSSREAAVTAMAKMGIRCVIADSFGDIFYANCFQNGLLPIRLPEKTVAELMAFSEASDSAFAVDLESCSIMFGEGQRYDFEIDSRQRDAMLQGLDDIGLTLRDADAIETWQHKDHADRSWIWLPPMELNKEPAR